MIEQKRILFVCDNSYANRPDIDELRFKGYYVTVAGGGCDGDGKGLAVDDAILRLVEDEEHFDLIISNMFMPYGNYSLSLEDTNNARATGRAFAEHLRDEGIDIPFIFYDESTGFMNCERYKPSKSTVGLKNGEVVPVVLRDGDYEPLLSAIEDATNKGDSPDLETHFEP